MFDSLKYRVREWIAERTTFSESRPRYVSDVPQFVLLKMLGEIFTSPMKLLEVIIVILMSVPVILGTLFFLFLGGFFFYSVLLAWFKS